MQILANLERLTSALEHISKTGLTIYHHHVTPLAGPQQNQPYWNQPGPTVY
jgi:hypothetical protein